MPNHVVNQQRHSIRLSKYDYSQSGAYFVTTCTKNRDCLFGDIVAGKMHLNNAGRIVAEEWLKIAQIYNRVEMDQWVVMPNHFHGILKIVSTPVPTPVGAIHESPDNKSPKQMTLKQRRNIPLSKMVGRFKMVSAKRINKMRQTTGQPLWQRNYWEHIVRNDTDLQRIREYIGTNATRWTLDALCPTKPVVSS